MVQSLKWSLLIGKHDYIDDSYGDAREESDSYNRDTPTLNSVVNSNSERAVVNNYNNYCDVREESARNNEHTSVPNTNTCNSVVNNHSDVHDENDRDNPFVEMKDPAANNNGVVSNRKQRNNSPEVPSTSNHGNHVRQSVLIHVKGDNLKATGERVNAVL